MSLPPIVVSSLSVLVIASPLFAGTITFEGLGSNPFSFDRAIQTTYQGFHWGYSADGGIADATIPSLDTSRTGWASATTSSPPASPPPTPVSGSTYAWNFNSPQSLFIDFLTPHDVTSGYFAKLSTDVSVPKNATAIQLFGYDESENLVASSSILNLTTGFQQINAGFTNVRFLEIRADTANRLFAVDDIVVSPSSVIPTPAAAGLGLPLLGMLGITRPRRQHMA